MLRFACACLNPGVTTGLSTESAVLQSLLRRIASREARVGVIGLGYVGLPLVLLFEQNGFPVIGFDVDSGKIGMLNRGESYICHIGGEPIRKAFGSRRAVATIDFNRLAECDAIVVCVPTPLGNHREPDLSYVRMTADAHRPGCETAARRRTRDGRQDSQATAEAEEGQEGEEGTQARR